MAAPKLKTNLPDSMSEETNLPGWSSLDDELRLVHDVEDTSEPILEGGKINLDQSKAKYKNLLVVLNAYGVNEHHPNYRSGHRNLWS